MPTLTIEIKKGRNKSNSVSFLICAKKTKKRISTGITVADSELSSNRKKIKNVAKAMLIETKRREFQDKLDQLLIDTIGRDVDAEYIVRHLLSSPESIDFFSFADDWLLHSSIKGKKNYICMLNALEHLIGRRELPFTSITYDFLKGFEENLRKKPRAQSLYLGLMRHLYREAMRRYNTDFDQVIKNDPFLRYRVPRQIIKQGVRALTLQQLMDVCHFKGRPHSRAQLARDCFMLSFCLMGMNSVDLYNATARKGNTICYNRTKTKDRRNDNAYIEVAIQPCIANVVKMYASKARVFNFYQRYSSAYDFNAAINKGLKEIGKSIGIDGLNFYQARHTFATLSRNLMRFSKGDVDEALNHVGSLELADIYIKKDFSIINDNNARLLQTIFNDCVI